MSTPTTGGTPVAGAGPSDEPGAAPQAVTPNLGGQVRRGALWSAGSTILMRFVNVALMAVVARIVAPEHVGIFALAMAAQAFIASVAELGVASAVARADLDADRIAPTVTTISILTSGTLAALMVAFAEPIATFLGSPEVAGPLRILAISVALIGPFAVPGAQLQREFRQSRIFVANALSFVTEQHRAGGPCAPRRRRDGVRVVAGRRSAGRRARGRGERVPGVPARVQPPGDRSAAGLRPPARSGEPAQPGGRQRRLRLRGPAPRRAVRGRVHAGVQHRRVGDRGHRVDAQRCRAARLLPRVGGPGAPSLRRRARNAGGGRRVDVHLRDDVPLAGPLVGVVYGAQWSDAGPVLSVLSVYGVVSVICLLFANITIAMGRTRALLAVQVAALVALVPAMLVGIQLAGIVGAGLAHVGVATLVTLPVYLVAVRSATGAGPGLLGRAVLPPLVASLLAWAAAHSVAGAIHQQLAALLAGGTVGALVFGVLMARDLLDVVGATRVPAPLARVVDRTEPLRRWLTRGPHPDDHGDARADPQSPAVPVPQVAEAGR